MLIVIGVCSVVLVNQAGYETGRAVTVVAFNVGPGVGDVVGPAGNFSSLPALAKWLLAAAMLLGRLELMTVAVLFSRHYWRG